MQVTLYVTATRWICMCRNLWQDYLAQLLIRWVHGRNISELTVIETCLCWQINISQVAVKVWVWRRVSYLSQAFAWEWSLKYTALSRCYENEWRQNYCNTKGHLTSVWDMVSVLGIELTPCAMFGRWKKRVPMFLIFIYKVDMRFRNSRFRSNESRRIRRESHK